MMVRLLFAFAALLSAACGGGLDLEPQPFTRERADGKIPVKTELIRQQVRAELAGMPEGEAKVRRWQAIEADYNACRLLSGEAKTAAEQVFADCMSQRGYVYMYRLDAEQLHNDIEFEMEKEHNKRIDAERRAKEDPAFAEQKAEEDRLAAEKKWRQEKERIRGQQNLNIALIYAVSATVNYSIGKVKRLIDEGADINARHKGGWTPLHYAADNGYADAVSVLIKAGADVNAKSKSGSTPLHWAAPYGQAEIIHTLIKAGADIDAELRDGRTPLYLATGPGFNGCKDETIALILIKAGANVNAYYRQQNSPHIYGTVLHEAVRCNQAELVFALVKAGADMERKTGSRQTPLDVADEDSTIAIFLRGAMEKKRKKDRQQAEELLRKLD